MPTVYIAGVNVTTHLEVDSCTIQGSLYGQWSLEATLNDLVGTFTVAKLSEIIVYDDDGVTKRFAGRISRVTKTVPPDGDDVPAPGFVFRYAIEARDYNAILSRRLCPGTIRFAAGTSIIDVLDHINENFLSGEGITIGDTDSPIVTLPEAVEFTYEFVDAIIEKLGAMFGYVGYVDFDKRLNFSAFTSNAAPFSITDTDGRWRSFQVVDSDDNYRNRQYERVSATIATEAGPDVSDPATIATAGQWQFKVSALVAGVSQVLVDGVSETFQSCTKAEWDAGVGSGTPPGSGLWYWISDMYTAEIDRIGNPLAGGEVVEFTYSPMLNVQGQGAGPQVVVVNDLSDQAVRAGLDGGSGIYEAIEDQSSIVSAATLIDIALGRLQQYREPLEISFDTFRAGLMPTQSLTVTLTRWGIDDVFVIRAVTYRWIASAPDYFVCSVTAGYGFGFGSSAEYLAKLVAMARKSVATASTVPSSILPSGLALTPPYSGLFTWVNQELATVDTSSGHPYLTYPAKDGQHWALWVTPLASQVFDLRVVIQSNWANAGHRYVGIVLYQESVPAGDGPFTFMGCDATGIYVYRYLNPHTPWSTALSILSYFPREYLFARITQDATHRHFYLSPDGFNWSLVLEQGFNDWVVPTHVGFALDPADPSTGCDLSALHWSLRF